MSLPQGAMGWSAVCYFGMSWLYKLTFCTGFILVYCTYVLHQIRTVARVYFKTLFYKRVVGFYKMHIYFQLHISIDEQINQRLFNFEQLDAILVTSLFGRHVYEANYFL